MGDNTYPEIFPSSRETLDPTKKNELEGPIHWAFINLDPSILQKIGTENGDQWQSRVQESIVNQLKKSHYDNFARILEEGSEEYRYRCFYRLIDTEEAGTPENLEFFKTHTMSAINQIFEVGVDKDPSKGIDIDADPSAESGYGDSYISTSFRRPFLDYLRPLYQNYSDIDFKKIRSFMLIYHHDNDAIATLTQMERDAEEGKISWDEFRKQESHLTKTFATKTPRDLLISGGGVIEIAWDTKSQSLIGQFLVNHISSKK